MRFASLLSAVLVLAACEDHGHHHLPPPGHNDGSTVWDLLLDGDALDVGHFPVTSRLFPAEVRLVPQRNGRYAVNLYGSIDFLLFDSYTNWPMGDFRFNLASMNGQSGDFVPNFPGTPFGFFDFWGGREFVAAGLGFTEVEFRFSLSPRHGTLENSTKADLLWSAELKSYGGAPGLFATEARFQGYQTVAIRLEP